MGGLRKRKPGAANSHTWFLWLRESYGCANFADLQNPLNIYESVPGREEIMGGFRTLSSPVLLGIT